MVAILDKRNVHSVLTTLRFPVEKPQFFGINPPRKRVQTTHETVEDFRPRWWRIDQPADD